MVFKMLFSPIVLTSFYPDKHNVDEFPKQIKYVGNVLLKTGVANLGQGSTILQ
jgi:hypothetical protein